MDFKVSHIRGRIKYSRKPAARAIGQNRNRTLNAGNQSLGMKIMHNSGTIMKERRKIWSHFSWSSLSGTASHTAPKAIPTLRHMAAANCLPLASAVSSVNWVKGSRSIASRPNPRQMNSTEMIIRTLRCMLVNGGGEGWKKMIIQVSQAPCRFGLEWQVRSPWTVSSIETDITILRLRVSII